MVRYFPSSDITCSISIPSRIRNRCWVDSKTRRYLLTSSSLPSPPSPLFVFTSFSLSLRMQCVSKPPLLCRTRRSYFRRAKVRLRATISYSVLLLPLRLLFPFSHTIFLPLLLLLLLLLLFLALFLLSSSPPSPFNPRSPCAIRFSFQFRMV